VPRKGYVPRGLYATKAICYITKSKTIKARPREEGYVPHKRRLRDAMWLKAYGTVN
jgi:hypothetical protein